MPLPEIGGWAPALIRCFCGSGFSRDRCSNRPEIGPEIDPGVPWTRVVDGPEMVVALKSGNFGAPDFFLKAWELLK